MYKNGNSLFVSLYSRKEINVLISKLENVITLRDFGGKRFISTVFYYYYKAQRLFVFRGPGVRLWFFHYRGINKLTQRNEFMFFKGSMV